MVQLGRTPVLLVAAVQKNSQTLHIGGSDGSQLGHQFAADVGL